MPKKTQIQAKFRGSLERKGPRASEEIGARMTWVDADAPLSEEPLRALACLLIDLTEQVMEKSRENDLSHDAG